jgi:hypothetical protein
MMFDVGIDGEVDCRREVETCPRELVQLFWILLFLGAGKTVDPDILSIRTVTFQKRLRD